MPLQTTVIGSFPKPDYLTVPDWFQTGANENGYKATQAYTELYSKQSEEDGKKYEEDLIRATREVIELQQECGVNVVTDGEVRRENYIHYLCRFMNGIDFANLSENVMRDGAYVGHVPTVTGKVSWRGPLDVVDEWRKAQQVSTSMVKYTLPGPMTIIGTLKNLHYDTEEALASDLAAIVNLHCLALAEAGCQHIQIDEPVFARYPAKALSWGIKLLDRCFEGVGSSCQKEVHICCGYPDHCDQEDYLKAEPAAYFQLAPALEASSVDAVSIEDAHRHNDLSLLAHFKTTKVIFGVVSSCSSKIETQEDIEARLWEALQHIDAKNLVVAPDCGLAMLPLPIIQQKLSNMCAAAQSDLFSMKRCKDIGCSNCIS